MRSAGISSAVQLALVVLVTLLGVSSELANMEFDPPNTIAATANNNFYLPDATAAHANNNSDLSDAIAVKTNNDFNLSEATAGSTNNKPDLPDDSAANTVHPSCIRLQELGPANVGKQYVSVDGQPVSMALKWGSDPARAASALLAADLRYVQGYQRVHLVSGSQHSTDIPLWLSYNISDLYKEEGSRLSEFGVSPVVVQRRLHAWLTPAARLNLACQRISRRFYANVTALAFCDFISAVPHPGYDISAVEVLGVGDDCNATMQRLQQRARAAGRPVHPRFVNRTILMRHMQSAKHSFLFLDFDFWGGEPAVSTVEPPPCESVDFHCNQNLDSDFGIRAADVKTLMQTAPQFLQLVQNFMPPRESLRLILEQEANGVDIEEAACNWALHQKYKNHVTKLNNSKNNFVAVYLCKGDPDNQSYDTIARIVGTYTVGLMRKKYFISIKRYFIDCSNAYDMRMRLDNEMNQSSSLNLLGVVSQTVEGAALASSTAAKHHVPLLLVDVVPEESATASADATWRVGGRPRHIARAVEHFVLMSGRTRVAVLSQPTILARHCLGALQDKAKIFIRDFEIPLNLTVGQAREVLQNIKVTNVRIAFINADSDAAAMILATAGELNMSYTDGFIWIDREWGQNKLTCSTKMKHFTVSLWDRGIKEFTDERAQGTLYKEMQAALRSPWPTHATSFANALLTLLEGLMEVFQKYPNTEIDLRNPYVIRLLNDSLIESPVTGVNGVLHYKERSIEETFVYVDEWCGNEFKQRLSTLRVNATSGVVRYNSSSPAYLTWFAHQPREADAIRYTSGIPICRAYPLPTSPTSSRATSARLATAATKLGLQLTLQTYLHTLYLYFTSG